MFKFHILFFYKALSEKNKKKIDSLQSELNELFEDEGYTIVFQNHLYRKNIIHNAPISITESKFEPLFLNFSHANYFVKRYICDLVTNNVDSDFTTLIDFLKQWKDQRNLSLHFKPYFWSTHEKYQTVRGELFYNCIYYFRKDNVSYSIPDDFILKLFLQQIGYHKYGFYVYRF